MECRCCTKAPIILDDYVCSGLKGLSVFWLCSKTSKRSQFNCLVYCCFLSMLILGLMFLVKWFLSYVPLSSLSLFRLWTIETGPNLIASSPKLSAAWECLSDFHRFSLISPHICPPLTARRFIRLSEFIFLSRSWANVPCCHTPQGNYYEGDKTGGT